MISSSIMWSLAGYDVDWTTKTSAPRTFSKISTKTSMSAKRRTTALASGVRRRAAIASARRGLELPLTSLIAPFVPATIHASRGVVFAGAPVMALSGQALTDSPSENAPNFQIPASASYELRHGDGNTKRLLPRWIFGRRGE